MTVNDEGNTWQFSIFKDCFSRRIIAQSRPSSQSLSTNDDSDLDELTSYLAGETWQSLPLSLHEATHESRPKITDPNGISLDTLPGTVNDTLAPYYSLTTDLDSSQIFVRNVLRDFISEACAPPPVWSSTRTKECEICEREVRLTYHHFIPRSTHAKVLKRRLHPESTISSVAWLCRFHQIPTVSE
ncbi:hypothetical protein EDB19DRAFT_1701062 [Suillus lakei]|nr:hypothetical protein EDB19DRAFT_1701062 [Suillus lakei]